MWSSFDFPGVLCVSAVRYPNALFTAEAQEGIRRQSYQFKRVEQSPLGGAHKQVKTVGEWKEKNSFPALHSRGCKPLSPVSINTRLIRQQVNLCASAGSDIFDN